MPFNQFRNREIARKTCIRGFTGRDNIRSGFFSAETLTANSEGRYIVPVGSFLSFAPADPTKVKIYEALGEDKNAVQKLTESGTPAGGSFTLTYGGATTGTIPYNAKGSEIVTKLVALSTIGSTKNIECGNPTKKITEEAIELIFIGELAHEPITLLTVNYSGLTGGTSPKVTATTTTAGQSKERICGVYDGPDQDFWGNTGAEVLFDEPVPIYYHSVAFDTSKLPQWTKYGLTAEEELKTCTFY